MNPELDSVINSAMELTMTTSEDLTPFAAAPAGTTRGFGPDTLLAEPPRDAVLAAWPLA
jgi:hypothetical protein